MSHQVESCDFIDMFEESARLHRPVVVTLRGKTRFSEAVRDVLTEDGADYVVFRDHGRVAVRDVLSCVWSEPRPETYDGKL
jgi:hypothetical protein